LQAPYFWTNQRQELHFNLLYMNCKKNFFLIILIKTYKAVNISETYRIDHSPLPMTDS